MFGLGSNNSQTASAQPQQSIFGQPQQTSSVFGASSQPQQSSGGFGGFGQNNQQQSTGIFGQSTQSQPQQQGGGLFGGLGQSTQQQPQQQQQQQGGGLFGGLGQNNQQQPQQQSGGLFSGLGQSTQQQPQQQQGGSLFGGLGQSTQQQPQQQGGGLFGGLGQSTQQQQLGPQQQQQPSLFGQSQQQPILQLGQSQQQGQLAQSQIAPPLWEEGRGLGVYRTIPAQMSIVKEKWDPNNLTSPLRSYLYQVVDEQSVPFYQPGPDEDAHKWEEAVGKRPGPNYVPAIARGFWDLGKRAQRQREFIEKCNIRLHEINQSLDAQLEIHSQRIATRMAECRRRHVVASQRTLALAAKIQVLRNRGYVMDNAEEEVRLKLAKLEREVFDPSLTGREQEIWARMLGIRERGKRLKVEMEKATPSAKNEDMSLDEQTVKTAKKALEAYDIQLRHLQKELQLVQQEYSDWEKTSSGEANGTTAARR